MKTIHQMLDAVESNSAEVLTLSRAQELIGKQISTIYFGYKGQDGLDNFTLGEIISRYDLALRTPYPTDQFPNLAAYWDSRLSAEVTERMKSELEILTSEGKETYIRCVTMSGEFNEPTFTCSDIDRQVYFVIDEN